MSVIIPETIPHACKTDSLWRCRACARRRPDRPADPRGAAASEPGVDGGSTADTTGEVRLGYAGVAAELLEFRAGLETECAGLAAIGRTDEDIRILKESFARLAEVQGEGGTGADDDLVFHLAIARASHNTYIIQVLEFLSDSMYGAISRSRELDATRTEFLANAHAEHAAIFQAIVAGDASAAIRSRRAHREAGQRRLLSGINPAHSPIYSLDLPIKSPIKSPRSRK